jgi:hypothetical protein
MTRARMLRSYRAKYADPIAFAAGEALTLGERDQEWPDFVWATDPRGRSGWAPLAAIDARLVPAIACESYSARELDADAGATLTLLRETGGWWWARNGAGAEGWLPARDLEIIEETT